MDTLPNLLVVFAGWCVGALVFVAVLRWISIPVAALAQATEAGIPRRSGKFAATVLAQSLFHSGPWLLAAVGFFAYEARAETWSLWFYSGFCGSVLAMACVTVWAAARIKRRGNAGGPGNAA
jgi:hypothetical protein